MPIRLMVAGRAAAMCHTQPSAGLQHLTVRLLDPGHLISPAFPLLRGPPGAVGAASEVGWARGWVALTGPVVAPLSQLLERVWILVGTRTAQYALASITLLFATLLLQAGGASNKPPTFKLKMKDVKEALQRKRQAAKTEAPYAAAAAASAGVTWPPAATEVRSWLGSRPAPSC